MATDGSIGSISELERDVNGIWTSARSSDVSYPETGHQSCMELESGSFWFRHRNRVIVDLVRRAPPPENGLLLEVGGGNGVVAAAIAAAGFHVGLLEPGSEGIRNAETRGIDLLIQSTFQDARFINGVLPAVGMFDVIEHVKDDIGFLLDVHRSLMSGGRVYATVPAYQCLWSEEDLEAGHYRRYTCSRLRKLFERAGFDVEYASYFFWPLPPPILLFRSLPYRLGIPRSDALADGHAEHGTREGMASRILRGLLKPEAKWLRRGGRLPFGGSCVILARA